MSKKKTLPDRLSNLTCVANLSPAQLKKVPGSRVVVINEKSSFHGSEGMAGDFRPGGGLLKADGFWVHLDEEFINANGQESRRKPFALKWLCLL